jgi:hypothetical protein
LSSFFLTFIFIAGENSIAIITTIHNMVIKKGDRQKNNLFPLFPLLSNRSPMPWVLKQNFHRVFAGKGFNVFTTAFAIDIER